jgi:hypothetical protein
VSENLWESIAGGWQSAMSNMCYLSRGTRKIPVFVVTVSIVGGF